MWGHRSPESHLWTQVLPSLRLFSFGDEDLDLEVDHHGAAYHHVVVFLHLRQWDHVHSSCTQEYRDLRDTSMFKGAWTHLTKVTLVFTICAAASAPLWKHTRC